MSKFVRLRRKRLPLGDDGDGDDDGGGSQEVRVLLPSAPENAEELRELRSLIETSLSLRPNQDVVVGLSYGSDAEAEAEEDEADVAEKKSKKKKNNTKTVVPFSALKNSSVFDSLFVDSDERRYDVVVAAPTSSMIDSNTNSNATGDDGGEGDEKKKDEEGDEAEEKPKRPEGWTPTLPKGKIDRDREAKTLSPHLVLPHPLLWSTTSF